MSRSRAGTPLTHAADGNLAALKDSRPAIMRRACGLAAPEGPTKTMNSPSRISKDRSSMTLWLPYFLATLRTSTELMGL